MAELHELHFMQPPQIDSTFTPTTWATAAPKGFPTMDNTSHAISALILSFLKKGQLHMKNIHFRNLPKITAVDFSARLHVW